MLSSFRIGCPVAECRQNLAPMAAWLHLYESQHIVRQKMLVVPIQLWVNFSASIKFKAICRENGKYTTTQMGGNKSQCFFDRPVRNLVNEMGIFINKHKTKPKQ